MGIAARRMSQWKPEPILGQSPDSKGFVVGFLWEASPKNPARTWDPLCLLGEIRASTKFLEEMIRHDRLIAIV